MRPGGRLSAAIEILAALESTRKPAPDVIRDWGIAHRFAGSSDRAAVANLVYDALRRRGSISFRMHSEAPRALALGALRWAWNWPVEQIRAAALDPTHGPGPLDPDEIWSLEALAPAEIKDHSAADIPEWLAPSLTRAFGDRMLAEGIALAQRAPVDLRVNSLKSAMENTRAALEKHLVTETPFSPVGLRMPMPKPEARAFDVDSHPVALKGWVEVQDEGSQLAAAIADARPGMLVMDLCAGSGGKTLALAAAMENRGQIFAYDSDPRRLAPIHERLRRSGVRNAQIRTAGEPETLGDLAGKMDLVVVDAPCTGAGTWRRRPDAKWRLRPGALAERQREQNAVLALGAPLVRQGGRLVYITCSMLPEENEARVADFLKANPEFEALGVDPVLRGALGEKLGRRLLDAVHLRPFGLQMAPGKTGTDAFYISVMERER